MQESLEARDRESDGVADYDDEKVLVQMNILKTIDQLVSSLEGTELLPQVEAIIGPALDVTIRNNLVGTSRRLSSRAPQSADGLSCLQSSTMRHTRSSTLSPSCRRRSTLPCGPSSRLLTLRSRVMRLTTFTV